MSEFVMVNSIRLGDLALTRSGDKGNHLNLGVVARDDATYRFLARVLTSERVRAYFAAFGVDRVERFELPNVGALNFMLYNALDGGASQSMRSDTQGKLFGTAAQEMPIPRDEVPVDAAPPRDERRT